MEIERNDSNRLKKQEANSMGEEQKAEMRMSTVFPLHFSSKRGKGGDRVRIAFGHSERSQATVSDQTLTGAMYQAFVVASIGYLAPRNEMVPAAVICIYPRGGACTRVSREALEQLDIHSNKRLVPCLVQDVLVLFAYVPKCSTLRTFSRLLGDSFPEEHYAQYVYRRNKEHGVYAYRWVDRHLL